MAVFRIIYLIHCMIQGASAEPLSDSRLLFTVLSGTAWYFGCVLFFMSIDEMGLSRSNQWKNLQGPFGAIFNLIFLAEYQQTNVFFILLSCAFILASAMLLSIKNDPSGKISRKGIFYAILAAVLFGINAMLLKMGTNFGLVYSQQFVLSGTVCLWSMIYLPLKEKRFIHLKDFSVRDNLLGILGGILYCAALFFFVKSYQLLPGSVAFTIIQLNAVWTILAGIFLFHEIEFRKNWKRILAGLLCACLGVIMLLFA